MAVALGNGPGQGGEGVVRYARSIQTRGKFMLQVNLHEARTRLSQLVQAALDGEDVRIARAGKPAVRLVPVVDTAVKTTGYGSLALLPTPWTPHSIPTWKKRWRPCFRTVGRRVHPHEITAGYPYSVVVVIRPSQAGCFSSPNDCRGRMLVERGFRLGSGDQVPTRQAVGRAGCRADRRPAGRSPSAASVTGTCRSYGCPAGIAR